MTSLTRLRHLLVVDDDPVDIGGEHIAHRAGDQVALGVKLHRPRAAVALFLNVSQSRVRYVRSR